MHCLLATPHFRLKAGAGLLYAIPALPCVEEVQRLAAQYLVVLCAYPNKIEASHGFDTATNNQR